MGFTDRWVRGVVLALLGTLEAVWRRPWRSVRCGLVPKRLGDSALAPSPPVGGGHRFAAYSSTLGDFSVMPSCSTANLT